MPRKVNYGVDYDHNYDDYDDDYADDYDYDYDYDYPGERNGMYLPSPSHFIILGCFSAYLLHTIRVPVR